MQTGRFLDNLSPKSNHTQNSNKTRSVHQSRLKRVQKSYLLSRKRKRVVKVPVKKKVKTMGMSMMMKKMKIMALKMRRLLPVQRNER